MHTILRFLFEPRQLFTQSPFSMSMVAFLLISTLGPGYLWAQKPSIQIHLTQPDVEIYGSNITVQDVVQYFGPKAIEQKVKNLIVDTLPDTKAVEVSAAQLRYLILLEFANRVEVQTRGLNSVQVRRVDPVGVLNRLTGQLESLLAERYQLPADKVMAEFPDTSQAQLKPRIQKMVGASWSLPRHTNFPIGPQTLQLQLSDGSQFPIPVDIGLVREIVVAQKTIARGETITQDAISRTQRPVFEPTIRLATYEQVVGTRAKSNIFQFSTIETNNIDARQGQSPNLVRANQPVRGAFNRGALKIEVFNLKTRQNGKLGDMVEVIYLPTGKKMIGRVAKENFVELY